jgi:glutathione S-transferase
MLCTAAFPAADAVDLYPEPLRDEIDRLGEFIYNRINNGTYKSGFATTQQAYDFAQRVRSRSRRPGGALSIHALRARRSPCVGACAAQELYSALDQVDAILAKQRFLAGDKYAHGRSRACLQACAALCGLLKPRSVFLRRFTEADLLLFPTMIRFDTAYAVLFKCAKRRAKDYPHLFAWMRDVYQLPLPLPTQLQVSPEVTVRLPYVTTLELAFAPTTLGRPGPRSTAGERYIRRGRRASFVLRAAVSPESGQHRAVRSYA